MKEKINIQIHTLYVPAPPQQPNRLCWCVCVIQAGAKYISNVSSMHFILILNSTNHCVLSSSSTKRLTGFLEVVEPLIRTNIRQEILHDRLHCVCARHDDTDEGTMHATVRKRQTKRNIFKNVCVCVCRVATILVGCLTVWGHAFGFTWRALH